MVIARFTPYPCATLMEECYRSDEWFDILERRELRQWAILEHRAVLAYSRDHMKRYRDPIEVLAADRRHALQLIGVYEGAYGGASEHAPLGKLAYKAPG